MQVVKTILKNKTSKLLVLLIAIILFEQSSCLVENIYATKIYVFIATIERALFYWLPFSVGDLFYIMLSVYILFKCVQFLKYLYLQKNRIQPLKTALLKSINFLLVVTIFFKLLWGINYSRLGVAHQFNLKSKTYTQKELETLIGDVIADANWCRKQISDTNLPQINLDSIYIETKNCYNKISKHYSFLTPRFTRVKPSLFSYVGSYLGYTGYYNPFSAEAQIRKDLPTILLSTIATHEMAHQLGYASEDEANFIGFIAANESDNILFRYSLDLELLDYSKRQLTKMYIQSGDFETFIQKSVSMNDCINKQVKKDRREIFYFFEKDRKDIASYSNFAYDKFLKLNKQTKGIQSYDEVIAWIIAYRKQFKTKK